MTGEQFATDTRRLALAYAAMRDDGEEWLKAWEADDAQASDELMEWEAEGCPTVGVQHATEPYLPKIIAQQTGRYFTTALPKT